MDIATGTNPAPDELPPCPACGQKTVRVYPAMIVLAAAIVAGVNDKLSATPGHGWRCTACGASGRAHPPTDAAAS